MNIKRKSVNKEYVEKSQVLYTEEDLREAIRLAQSVKAYGDYKPYTEDEVIEQLKKSLQNKIIVTKQTIEQILAKHSKDYKVALENGREKYVVILAREAKEAMLEFVEHYLSLNQLYNGKKQ